ncbi:MAG: YggS family pyridoxal phosphate-dependent enzyme, partial [Candidatus Cloacimonadota bacterium]|nr:YggS family pyridoxal phosphate-dependent enzyme [Candidatus Cloacimonadota bacterium]
NKAKLVVPKYDMIESLDSLRLAKQINKECEKIDKIINVLIEINSGREEQKTGFLPENAVESVKLISRFKNLRIRGLMTMGPFSGNPESARPYFVETKKIFDNLKSLAIPNVEMKYLSMGMSNSYKIAIEEGANLVRIGTNIFGARK